MHEQAINKQKLTLLRKMKKKPSVSRVFGQIAAAAAKTTRLPKKIQPFPLQKGGQRQRNMKKFTEVTSHLSGNRDAELLAAYFDTRKGKQTAKSMQEQHKIKTDNTYLPMITHFGRVYNNQFDRILKQQLLSCVAPFIGREHLRKFGWKVIHILITFNASTHKNESFCTHYCEVFQPNIFESAQYTRRVTFNNGDDGERRN